MRIYVIRHGETALNAQGRLQGLMDVPLNESGIELAEVTGRALKGVRFDLCLTSPLLRARQTARILLRESGNDQTPVAQDERIREIDMGRWEGLSIKDGARSDQTAAIAGFFSDPFASPGPPGGETCDMVCRRTQAFLNELCARRDIDTCLVSTHGFALRAMLNKLYPDPSDFWQGHAPYNCAVSIIDASGGAPRLEHADVVYYDPALAVDRYR